MFPSLCIVHIEDLTLQTEPLGDSLTIFKLQRRLNLFEASARIHARECRPDFSDSAPFVMHKALTSHIPNLTANVNIPVGLELYRGALSKIDNCMHPKLLPIFFFFFFPSRPWHCHWDFSDSYSYFCMIPNTFHLHIFIDRFLPKIGQ